MYYTGEEIKASIIHAITLGRADLDEVLKPAMPQKLHISAIPHELWSRGINEVDTVFVFTHLTKSEERLHRLFMFNTLSALILVDDLLHPAIRRIKQVTEGLCSEFDLLLAQSAVKSIPRYADQAIMLATSIALTPKKMHSTSMSAQLFAHTLVHYAPTIRDGLHAAIRDELHIRDRDTRNAITT